MSFKKSLLLPILLSVCVITVFFVVLQKNYSVNPNYSSVTPVSVTNDALYTNEKDKFSFQYPSSMFKPESSASINSSWIYQPLAGKYIRLGVDAYTGTDFTQWKSIYDNNKSKHIKGFDILSETDNGSYTTSIVHTLTDEDRAIDGNAAYAAYIWPKNEKKVIILSFYSNSASDDFVVENKPLFDSIMASFKFSK